MSKPLTFNQRWFCETTNAFMPVIAGMLGTGLVTILVAAPTKSTYIWWGVLVVVFLVFSLAVGYDKAREKLDSSIPEELPKDRRGITRCAGYRSEDFELCEKCNGTGGVEPNWCHKCGGYGEVPVDEF